MYDGVYQVTIRTFGATMAQGVHVGDFFFFQKIFEIILKPRATRIK